MTFRAPYLFLVCSALGVLSCKPKVPVTPALPKNTFVLLPDSDGKVGAISVSNAGGSVDLNKPYTAVLVSQAAQAPSSPFAITKPDVDRIFGPALNLLPASEQSFLVYFELNRDDFMPDTRAILNQALNAIAARHSTDVSVVGHADSAGDSLANYQLALRRARRVADALAAIGVGVNIISIESRGDADPLVKTARGQAEPRNRRVEIVVR